MIKDKQIGFNFDNSYERLPDSFYSHINPNPVQSPQLVILNGRLAASLGLDAQALQSEKGLAVLGGNEFPAGAASLAQAYTGHQFGHFTMLGDGRAVLVGEQITPQGERFDIQLKGSGRTPYSRGGDGRAALGPMLREYIISEAMHALGVPTTRSLAVVTTGEPVFRETELPGAILTRVAKSHLRVGTFQYAGARNAVEDLRALADYAIARHYPEVEKDAQPYLAFFRKVMDRQASLIAKWQLVGFVHGVMNTDNMTISGETIDYGPCAFIDEYHPETVFSSIDVQGRYAYGNQPGMGAWNLARFAEALLPLLHEDIDEAVKIAQEEISGFNELFNGYWLAGMRAKLGIFNEEEQDEALIGELLACMDNQGADYTNTFRALTLNELDHMPLFQTKDFKQWHEKWLERLKRQPQTEEDSRKMMQQSNPTVIPRNHRVEEALEAAVEKGDFSVMQKLLSVLSEPYAYSPEQTDYCTVPASSSGYRTYCGT